MLQQGEDEEDKHGPTLRHFYNRVNTIIAGHIIRLQSERPAHTAMHWVPENERRKMGRRDRGEHFKKTWRRFVSAGMEPAGSKVTETDGDF